MGETTCPRSGTPRETANNTDRDKFSDGTAYFQQRNCRGNSEGRRAAPATRDPKNTVPVTAIGWMTPPTWWSAGGGVALPRSARRNPSVLHPELQKQLLQATAVNISVKTIGKSVRAQYLYSTRQLRVPELSTQHKIDRLNWCLNTVIELLEIDETRIGLKSDDR
ncbi:hypothetical protein ABEB36_010641 [Hypothenemus hampei]|uniref:Transposase Tc1-like domain-containing protein n=1 Tax=Hypothenemus hampei TaxID=57062 RepID=A0ABD1ECQ7_HYPHA